MKILIQKSNSNSFEDIDLDDNPLGIEYSSVVYKITNNEYKAEFCVKIFKNIQNIDVRKIQYLLNNPMGKDSCSPVYRVCTPIAIAYNLTKQPIGYMMPLAFENSRDLTILTNSRIGKSISKIFPKFVDWHNKYELNEEIGLSNRMKMVANIAITLHKVHETKHYIFADIKPENILATSIGRISIVDTDLFQIYKNNRLLFKASAYTEDYLAPDAKPYIKNNQPIPQSCDFFSAAVLFYQILVGIHPFVGFVVDSKYANNLDGTTSGNMAMWLFPFGKKAGNVTILPNNPHHNFNILPVAIQQLFVRTFDSDTNLRPTMETWAKTIQGSLNN